ncbi:hypothetical protein Tco_0497081 [Tanacetum coccineum]
MSPARLEPTTFRDDLVENKGSDKRGWSLRKKTASQWVLSNTIITELPSSENKISEPAIVNSEAPTTSSISEKTSANLWTEILPRVSTSNTKGTKPSNTKLTKFAKRVATEEADSDGKKYVFGSKSPADIWATG